MSPLILSFKALLVVTACIIYSFTRKKRKENIFSTNVNYLLIGFEITLMFAALLILILFMIIPSYNYYT